MGAELGFLPTQVSCSEFRGAELYVDGYRLYGYVALYGRQLRMCVDIEKAEKPGDASETLSIGFLINPQKQVIDFSSFTISGFARSYKPCLIKDRLLAQLSLQGLGKDKGSWVEVDHQAEVGQRVAQTLRQWIVQLQQNNVPEVLRTILETAVPQPSPQPVARRKALTQGYEAG